MNRTPALVPLFTVVLAAALAGCGSRGGQATATTQRTSTQSRGGGAASSLGSRTFPGAFGVAAAVGKTSLEVQNPQTGQTTVRFTGTTKFQRTESATLAQVTVGSCVTVTSSTAPSGSTVAARGVDISAPVKGACTGRRGGSGPGGSGPGGFGVHRTPGPAGRPTARPKVRPSRPPRSVNVATAIGKVTAVSGGGFTMRGFVRAFRPGTGPRPSASPRPTASPVTRSVTVTVTHSTTYSRTVAATHTALKVGQCIAALGKTDDTGAVTATFVTISAPVNGSCVRGGGFIARGGAGGNSGTGGSNA